MPRVRAPEFPPSLLWLNTQPLTLKALQGRVVLLDFWTYGCINCLHILPDLEYLERKYPDGLTVIGVHAAKFDHEHGIEPVRQAVLKYNIQHPVLVDAHFQVWQSYAVRAYPTLVLIDQNRYVVSQLSGEGHRERLDHLIGMLLDQHPGRSPRMLFLEQQQFGPTPLAFPGKVLVGSQSHGEASLFIADTGHHRIVATTLAGELIQTIGTGTPGLRDGDLASAQLSAPQGMAWDADNQILYIADTGNHGIRRVDWRSGKVEAIAGTGQQSQILYPHGGMATEIALNSPWDLALVGSQLFIAMAGSHQIWQLDLAAGRIQTYLGTGAEACVDGLADQAAFAQPSGLTVSPVHDQLFVADSEGSTIRVVTLGDRPSVQTLCGSGTLYGFGDVDGSGETARLQHCLGLTQFDGALWVADTYNHKIKRVDPLTGDCQTVAGTGSFGYQEGLGTQAQFFEPSGLSGWEQRLYIADTNNHQIRQFDLVSGQVTTLQLPKLCPPGVCLPTWDLG